MDSIGATAHARSSTSSRSRRRPRFRRAWKHTVPRPTHGGTDRAQRGLRTGSLAGTIWGLELYARQSGGCRDGLHADRGNENQGAESTLAFLLSQAEMRLIQNTVKLVQRSGMTAATANETNRRKAQHCHSGPGPHACAGPAFSSHEPINARLRLRPG